MKSRSLFLTILAPTLVFAGSLRSQENQELGRMWTYENPPLAYLEKEYGFKPDQTWLANLRMAALRLGGDTRGFCSASFVSPKGLIMTNNHCVRDAVAATSKLTMAKVKTGFTAAAYEEEVRLTTGNDGWLSVSQLNKMADVTARVNEGITAEDSEAEIKQKREANKEKILEEAKKNDPNLKPQVVSLYQGGIFQLYQYKVYDDVRLVCTPHLQSAHFGGDPDNFTYPRYSMDFAFLRAYVDGKPADTTKHYFKWKMEGAKEGDLVFVPGNPGTTERLNTKAQMDFFRDVKQPIILELLDNRLAIFRKIIERIPQLKDQFATQMLQWENGQKAIGGELSGLRDAALMAQKERAEAAFKARVMKDPALKAKYGTLWEDIAEVAKDRREVEPLTMFRSSGFLSKLSAAVTVVQAVDPDGSEETREAALKSVPTVRAQDNIITQQLFIDHVERARKWLKKDDPYLTEVLGGAESGRAALAALQGSKVGNPKFRSDLVEGGWDAVKASEDPAIAAARALVPLMRADSKRSEELDAREEKYGAMIGRALFACYGTAVSPDATMTPRFADGVVKGFKYNGTIAPYRTTFYGLYARNIEFDGEYPFNLPAVWLEKKDQIDMTKAVNFVSTNDIVGGNSGSVVVNKELEVVGLIFDGNIESLPNSYVYKDDVPRSVSVHVEGIMESLLKVYDAEHVAKELQGK
jgi:hypothetical protein